MKNVFLFLAVLIGFSACQKDDKSAEINGSNSSYLPMSVGNYWVYEERNLDNSGNAMSGSAFDSLVISKDTLIQGKTFFKFDTFRFDAALNVRKAELESSAFYADSSKSLISLTGDILFSEDNFKAVEAKSIFAPEGEILYSISSSMENVSSNVVVPAGTFTELLCIKGTVTCNPKYTSIPNPRFTYKYYAKNIGVILYSNVWFSSGGTQEHRLVRCKIYKQTP
jgi:hypothetical protein